MTGGLTLREAGPGDREAVLALHRSAFGQEEEADLVAAILDDPTAQPLLSLLAEDDDGPVGHILFSAARLEGPSESPHCALLAPLAVLPEKQSAGVGSVLAEIGLERLKEAGCALVFVLGHPDYYPRFGFRPAGALGCAAPYPIAPEHAGAWMVAELAPGLLGPALLGEARGTVRCCAAIDAPHFWQE